MLAGFAFAAHAQARAIVHTGRNFNLKLGFDPFASAAFAIGARVFDNCSLAAAFRAGLNGLELSKGRFLGGSNLTATAAARASSRTGTLFSSAAMTSFAGFPAGNGNIFFAAENGFLKINYQVIAHIGAPFRSSLGRGTAAAEKHIKNIAHIAKAAESSTGSAAKSAVCSGMTKLVILGTFLRIGEVFIGFVNLFKFFLCFFIAGVDIWMILPCQFAVGFFYFIITCCFFYPQHFIVITFVSHYFSSLTSVYSAS